MMGQINFNVSGTPTSFPKVFNDTPTYTPDGVYEGNPPNRYLVRIPANMTGGGHFDWQGVRYDFLIPTGTVEASSLGLPALEFAPEVTRLIASGESLYKDGGSKMPLALHTDFRLYKKWMDGDRNPLLQERITAGSMGPRVFLTCDFLFKVGPHIYGVEFYNQLAPFADYLAKKGMFWEAVVYTDRQLTGLGNDVWPRVCQALAGKSCLISLVNEYFKNGVDPRQFQPIPNGCPQNAGSFVDGMFPIVNWGPNSYHAFNPSRGWKWPATVGITLWELKASWPGVWLIDEPMGADEFDQPGRRASNPELFRRMAADCRVWGAGGVFHSQAGLNSEPWGSIQTACARAFFDGFRGKGF